MEKKDYFSNQSETYARFRPKYPEALYQFIFAHLKKRSCAWDCATGNGQVAQVLASHFDNVYATDISQQQLDNAFRAENIVYTVAPAEKTEFDNNRFDLITVAQALHWFDLPSFYSEVRRTIQSQGILAVWGYAMLTVDPAVDALFLDFYHNKVGPYWDNARKLVENHYRDIPFPFKEIPCPEFFISVKWTHEQFTGYLSSWSATQKYVRTHDVDPVLVFSRDLQAVWKPGESKLVRFPVFMKMAVVD